MGRPEITDRQQMTDHDLLIRIDERTEGTTDRVENHAKRIRTLEQNHSKIVDAVIMIGAGVTIIVNIMFHILDRVWK